MISTLCHCSNPSIPTSKRFVRARKVKSPSMGRDGDSNHQVSGGDLDGDSDFTQPSLPSSGF